MKDRYNVRKIAFPVQRETILLKDKLACSHRSKSPFWTHVYVCSV